MKHQVMKTMFCAFFGILQIMTIRASNDLPEVTNYTVSPPYKVIDAHLKYYISNGKDILSLKFIDENIYFQSFDGKNMNLILSNKLEDMPSVMFIEGIKQINEKFYLFYSENDEERDKVKLYAREFSFELCDFISNPILLVETDGKISRFSAYGMGPTSPPSLFDFNGNKMFNIQFSADNKKMLIHHRFSSVIADDSKNYDKIGIYVYDNNLEVIWKKDITMPYTETQMGNRDFKVDAKGNVYVLALNPEDNSRKELPRELLKYEAITGNLLKIKIETSGNSLGTNLELCDGMNNNNMLITGYSTFTSVFSLNIDSLGKITNQNQFEIPADILSQNEVEKKSKKKSKELEDVTEMMLELKFKEIFKDKDGSFLRLEEQSNIETKYKTTSNLGATKSEYGSILASKYSQEGEILWVVKIPKNQHGGAIQGNLSFTHASTLNYHYFLFFDNYNNYNLDETYKPEKYFVKSEGFLTCYQVNKKTGEKKRITLLNTQSVKGIGIDQFTTQRIFKFDDNNIIMEAYKGKKEDIMIKMPLE